jgi:hypothetical protein
MLTRVAGDGAAGDEATKDGAAGDGAAGDEATGDGVAGAAGDGTKTYVKTGQNWSKPHERI